MNRMGDLESALNKDGVIFLTYGGILTQALLVALTEALEKGGEETGMKMKTSINIMTIFIELSQNIMNYARLQQGKIEPKGMVVVGEDGEGNHYVFSQNKIALADKEKIDKKMKTIMGVDKDTIKKLYREARRSGKDAHSRGGGIGFYEIAKRCDSVDYEFESIDEDTLYFRLKTTLYTSQA